MTAKEYLRQLWLLEKEIKRKQGELAEAETMAISISSPQITDMPKAHNGSDSVSDAVCRIIELRDIINDRIDELIDLKIDIIQKIDGLSDVGYRIVLEERYIDHRDWLDIADDMNYSVQHIYRIHGYALKEFNDKYMKR